MASKNGLTSAQRQREDFNSEQATVKLLLQLLDTLLVLEETTFWGPFWGEVFSYLDYGEVFGHISLDVGAWSINHHISIYPINRVTGLPLR